MMTLSIHAYHAGDLHALLTFVGVCSRACDFCGVLHPGDIRHALSNGLRGEDPSDYFQVARDENEQIIGVVMNYRAVQQEYEVIVHPEHRGSEFERALIAHAEARQIEIMRRFIHTCSPRERERAQAQFTWVGSAAMPCDSARNDALRAAGYTIGEAYMMLTRRDLNTPIPYAPIPEDFHFRPATRDDADALGALHSAAFDSGWKPGEYRRVMDCAAFEIENELLVVAPGERLAAFTVIWIDPISESGLFEPVGCHPDFQRKGLTRALLYEGMRRMQAAGAQTALVTHELEDENPASARLYASVGFKPIDAIHEARKPITLYTG